MKRKSALVLIVLLLAVGIAFAFTTTGPLFPTAATGNTNTIGGGTIVWTTPTNIELNDGSTANCLPGVAITDDLRGGVFGFTISSTDTVNGIQLEVNAQTATTTNVEAFNTVVLEGGGGASANRAAGTLVPAFTTFSFGGPTDLWGTTWTPAQINAGTFVGNVTFRTTGGGPGTVGVDFMRITVTSTPGNSSGFLKMFGFKTYPPQPHTQTRTISAAAWVPRKIYATAK